MPEGIIMPANISAEALTEAGQVKLSETVVTYSSTDYPDGEIWFVIVPNDPDLAPFWREVELNQELEENGITWRFDPSDKLWDDESMDYDDDGVPNAVEQLIGKDPAKKDILGISLTVSTEWALSDEDKRNLVYSIRKASDFVYDYTDGYAMITSVQIWDDKRHWEDADIQIYDGSCIVGVSNTGICPYTQPIGGYWTGGNITMPKSFRSPLKNADKLLHDPLVQSCIDFNLGNLNLPGAVACVYASLDEINLGSPEYGRALAHELGHYVFWLGDEYMDWHRRIYYLPDKWGMLWTVLFGGLGYSQTTAGWFYDNRVPPHSIMDMTYEYSELSWPADYDRFKAKLNETFKGEWEEHLTDQWGNVTKNPKTDYSIWHCSAWEALFRFLSGYDRPGWVKGPNMNLCMDLNLDGICDRELSQYYIPKTGPYTGVGYFMEVIWG